MESSSALQTGTVNSVFPDTLAALPDERRDIIGLVITIFQSLGLPRSSGEIFGYVMTAGRAVTFDDVIHALGMSAGAASQGLRLLQRVGALNIVYVPGDRRDHFTAVKSLRKLTSRCLAEMFGFRFRAAQERLGELAVKLQGQDHPEIRPLAETVDLLSGWNRQIGEALNAALSCLQ